MNTLSGNRDKSEIEAPLAVRKSARTPQVLKGVTPEQSDGMLARALVLDNERSENFTMLTNDYFEVLEVANEMERGMVEEMAAANWRMRRYWALETQFLNAEMPDDQVSDVGHGPDSFDGDVYVEEMNRQAASFRKLAEGAHFKLLLRQQVTLQRSFHQTLRALFQFRKWAGAKS